MKNEFKQLSEQLAQAYEGVSLAIAEQEIREAVQAVRAESASAVEATLMEQKK